MPSLASADIRLLSWFSEIIAIASVRFHLSAAAAAAAREISCTVRVHAILRNGDILRVGNESKQWADSKC